MLKHFEGLPRHHTGIRADIEGAAVTFQADYFSADWVGCLDFRDQGMGQRFGQGRYEDGVSNGFIQGCGDAAGLGFEHSHGDLGVGTCVDNFT